MSIEEMFNRYIELKDLLAHIKNGIAHIEIHARTQEGFTTEYILQEYISEDVYLKRAKGDVMMALREIRKDLINALMDEHEKEIGGDPVEPFPVGTPKNDYRRHESDDGK